MGTKGEKADYYNNWYMLEAHAWAHMVDRPYNAQVKRFNSRYACPGSEVASGCWLVENNWWCLPPALIPRILSAVKHREDAGESVPAWYPL